MTCSIDPSERDATERVLSREPFIVRRCARWAECDPAGVVHTGRFGDYALSATDLFRAHVIGRDWHRRNSSAGFGSPAKAISLVFHSPLWPGDQFDIAVFVGEIRVRSMDLLLSATRSDDGRAIFRGRLSSICVTAEDRTVAMPWPDDYRERYRSYARHVPVPADLQQMGP
ncbi:hypothetical protein FG93_05114 [Bosea sp. LC85]|uniref:acyl-CoA thioesterase n=1 Tax=Bosea sp. LC85 TaxID=1502851 RepID=UPI0004E30968|nr:acyl-CoA thioesterase [Bosea sp. LC85]KFC64824.1 hypothetical protein FG93_05114 [Bosea sp. LC85]